MSKQLQQLLQQEQQEQKQTKNKNKQQTTNNKQTTNKNKQNKQHKQNKNKQEQTTTVQVVLVEFVTCFEFGCSLVWLSSLWNEFFKESIDTMIHDNHIQYVLWEKSKRIGKQSISSLLHTIKKEHVILHILLILSNTAEPEMCFDVFWCVW